MLSAFTCLDQKKLHNQMSSEVESMDDSSGDIQGSSYLQLDRISDMGDDNSLVCSSGCPEVTFYE